MDLPRENNTSLEETSDDDIGLKIVEESPKSKRKSKPELDETAKQIIACVEKHIEDTLQEKAARANLSIQHVKHILKQVVTNEDVLALVRHAENPEGSDKPVPAYEPKCTRAKTKELLSAQSSCNIISWTSPQTPSETHMLLQEEALEEDSSGDEYVPNLDQEISPTKSINKDEVPNIALRTRSKLCLSQTPLEKIEEAFIPPDITTDMYDMDCDDDVWTDFLTTFTKPLDEVTKQVEDEDHDPEYNILADEEIDKVDKEELRADRAVTVSRKEFNALMAELFEYTDVYESNQIREKNRESQLPSTIEENEQDHDQSLTSTQEFIPADPNVTILISQLPLLAQQMRQHVQLLTQNFLLTYDHPELGDVAIKCKQCLESFKAASEGKTASLFNTVNLTDALKLIEDWENMFVTNSPRALEAKVHVLKDLCEWNESRLAQTDYVPKFPPLVMETISKSKVFLYPQLLPRVPFRGNNNKSTKRRQYFFTNSEDNLIALFMEQVMPYLKHDQQNLTSEKKVKINVLALHIHRSLMPSIPLSSIAKNIRNKKNALSTDNPINHYFKYHKAPINCHCAIVLDPKDVQPPKDVPPEVLPPLWKEFIYPVRKEDVNNKPPDVVQTIIISPVKISPQIRILKPLDYNSYFSEIFLPKLILPRTPLESPPSLTPKPKRRKKTILKPPKSTLNKEKPPPILKPKNHIRVTMLHQSVEDPMPDMPSLGGTPVKSAPSKTTAEKSEVETQIQELSFQNILQRCKVVGSTEISGVVRKNPVRSNEGDGKDNPEDIDELMRASSTVKIVAKKEPSGAEKKRTKMKREFLSNLIMATPDDPETAHKRQDELAKGYFAKLKTTLDDEDYSKIIKIMKKYNEMSERFTDLYNKIQGVLSEKYPELANEFLLFLTDTQAQQVGKLMPYFMMKDMNKFLEKLQVYFKDQPNQLKKIWKCLTDLTENPEVDMDAIKNTMLPLFKGNETLIGWFLQMFPGERPMKVISNGPSEKVDLSKELARPPEEDIYETIVVPDTEDPYGGPGCICDCHSIENIQLQLRSMHCSRCGLKFIQGKVYVQTGKGLRPANVSFLTNPDKDHTLRLNASPNKQTSPNKDGSVEESHSCYSVERNPDGTKKRLKRKRKKEPSPEKPITKESSSKKIVDKNVTAKTQTKAKKVTRKRSNSGSKNKIKPGSSSGQVKRSADEDAVEKSEMAQSAESESEIFESTQDLTNTDSEDSGHRTSSAAGESDTWTRIEDKVILKSFQQKRGSEEETFQKISETLRNRSVGDIKNRFKKLMTLLQQMESE